MSIKLLRTLPIALFAVLLMFGAQRAPAQGTDAKAPTTAPVDPTKEFTDAGRLIQGPAGNPECFWLGKRVVSRLYDDDLDTALRHLDFYDRFGCPGPHIQQAFRCVVRQGNIDRKATADNASAKINDRVNACWLNPAMAAQPAAAAPTPTGAR